MSKLLSGCGFWPYKVKAASKRVPAISPVSPSKQSIWLTVALNGLFLSLFSRNLRSSSSFYTSSSSNLQIFKNYKPLVMAALPANMSAWSVNLTLAYSEQCKPRNFQWWISNIAPASLGFPFHFSLFVASSLTESWFAVFLNEQQQLDLRSVLPAVHSWQCLSKFWFGLLELWYVSCMQYLFLCLTRPGLAHPSWHPCELQGFSIVNSTEMCWLWKYLVLGSHSACGVLFLVWE